MLRFSMFIQLLWRSCYTRTNILHISLWYDTTTQNRIVNSWLKFWISGVWITIRRLCWVQGFKNHCTVGHFLGHPLCFNFKISKIICKTFNSPFSKSIALCFTNLHLCDLFNICPQSAMFARNLFSQFSQRLNFRRWKGFWNFGAPPPPFLQAKSTKKYLARHLRTKTNKTVFPLNFLKSYSLQEKMSFTGTIISQKLQQNFWSKGW